MIPIFRKELNSFFSSMVGYVAIMVFLLLAGFFMFVSPDSNLLDFGYASMDRFFEFAPWILLFLIPAITMRSFADEARAGTLEILFTLPLKERDIILGKYLANMVVVLFAIMPTLLYVFTLAKLSLIPYHTDTAITLLIFLGLVIFSILSFHYALRFMSNQRQKFFSVLLSILLIFLIPVLYLKGLALVDLLPSNLDSGGIMGSYIGLIFLCSAFTAVGVFCSALSSNQVVAFILAVVLNFILFNGFETISHFQVFENGLDYVISQVGMQFHYTSISRGLLDTRDLVYFLSISALFILIAKFTLNKRKWS